MVAASAVDSMQGDSSATDEFARRFSGIDRLYGPEPAARIKAAHIAVIGIGGVGSWAAEALARSGVGEITLIDLDHIAESNINRQVHALSNTVGAAKVDAMRDRIALINPLCRVHAVDAFADESNWPALLPYPVDAVIDACDQIRTKTCIAAWALASKTIFVSIGAAGGKRHAHKIEVADLSEVTHDPLAAQLRYRLRKFHHGARDGKKMGVVCVFNKEAVARADPTCVVQSDSSLNCHGYGSMVTVTASFGLCAAGWVMDKISEASSVRGLKNAII
jgi:tRNA A37 threonylcarbamoyladenosine dehydratase